MTGSRVHHLIPLTILALILGVLIALIAVSDVRAEEPISGTASWYGPGTGVATPWCTWVLRHSEGCGSLTIQSHQTGITVTAPVVDWCQCYRGTSQERIVDLQWGVVDALGLPREQGLYAVTTWRVGAPSVVLPNTSMEVP